MRWLPVLGLLGLLFAFPAVADDTVSESMTLEGTTAMVTLPGAGFRKIVRKPKGGEWLVTFHRSGGGLELEARVFQARADATAPEAILVQSLDTLCRTRGYDGFGIPSRRSLDVWGRPAAEGAFQAAVDGKVARGLARVIRIDDHQWVFAWGLAFGDFKASDLAKIRTFVESLEPQEPSFYQRRFNDPSTLADVVTLDGVTPPVTRGDMDAAVAIIEFGLEQRLSLADRAALLRGLTADLEAGSERDRQNYVAVGAEVRGSMKLHPRTRQQALTRRGKHVLMAMSQRGTDGYPPAVQTMVAVGLVERTGIPGVEDAPTRGALAAWLEHATFLASLAADTELVLDVKATQALYIDLTSRWKDLDLTEQLGIREIGTTWAAFRHAWDTASDDARFAFRKAVAARLSPESEREAIEGLETRRDLKRWFAEKRSDEQRRALLDAAATLTVTDRSLLFLVLDVESEGYQFGW